MCLVFLIGLATVPFAPETLGKPLPSRNGPIQDRWQLAEEFRRGETSCERSPEKAAHAEDRFGIVLRCSDVASSNFDTYAAHDRCAWPFRTAELFLCDLKRLVANLERLALDPFELVAQFSAKSSKWNFDYVTSLCTSFLWNDRRKSKASPVA
jgi:hypothetical protein